MGVGRHSIFERGSSNWAPFNSFLIVFSGRLSARKCYIRIILTKQSCSLVKNVHSLDGSGNLSTRNRTGEKVFKSPTFIRSVEIRNKEKSCHTRKNVVSSFSFMLRRSFLTIFFILFEFYSRINNVSDYLLLDCFIYICRMYLMKFHGKNRRKIVDLASRGGYAL